MACGAELSPMAGVPVCAPTGESRSIQAERSAGVNISRAPARLAWLLHFIAVSDRTAFATVLSCQSVSPSFMLSKTNLTNAAAPAGVVALVRKRP
jgi:hypothetical protein